MAELKTVGDLYNSLHSAFDDIRRGRSTLTLDRDLEDSLSTAVEQLGDLSKKELKTSLSTSLESRSTFSSLSDLSNYLSQAISTLDTLSNSLGDYNATKIKDFHGQLTRKLSPITTSSATSSLATNLGSTLASSTTFVALSGSTSSTATYIQPNNLFAEPILVSTSASSDATASAAAGGPSTAASQSATSTSSTAADPARDHFKRVHEHLTKFKADKGKDLDDETRAILDATIEEVGVLGQGGTGGGPQTALNSTQDLEAFVGNAISVANSFNTTINNTTVVLNPAGFAPPGLNKLKDHLGKKHNPVPVPVPVQTPPGTGTTSSTTAGSTTSSTTAGSTSSTGGNININVGTGSTSGSTGGGTGGSTTTGGASGSGGAGSTGGSGSGAPLAGTAQTVADFGQITINGHTTYLGSVQAPYMTTAQAAEYVAGAINADPNSTVTASVNDQGQLQLTSKTGGAISIDRVGVSTTGDLSQLVDIGLQAGTYGSSVTAGAPTSPYFADTFDQVYQAIASGSMTAPSMSSSAFSPATATAPTTTYSQSSSATIAPATTTTASSSTWSASTYSGTAIAGQTNINQPITAYSLTDFGTITISGRKFNLGSIKTIDYTKEAAAQYLANVFNVQGGGMLTAQAQGSQLILNSTTGGALTVQSVSPTLDMSNPQNRFGFAGFYAGQLGAGSLIGSSLIL